MATQIPEIGDQASALDLSPFVREGVSKMIQFRWLLRFMNLEASSFYTGCSTFVRESIGNMTQCLVHLSEEILRKT